MFSPGSRAPLVIGRQQELADLDRFLAEDTGLPAALVLVGEAGIGKTTLWRSAVAAAADSHFVLSAQPVAAEAELSHASLSISSSRCVADVLPACRVRNDVRSRARCSSPSRKPIHNRALSRLVS